MIKCELCDKEADVYFCQPCMDENGDCPKHCSDSNKKIKELEENVKLYRKHNRELRKYIIEIYNKYMSDMYCQIKSTNRALLELVNDREKFGPNE